MILMIDNYDSFTYNLVQELGEISGARIEVVRNDVKTVSELLAMQPQAIVISPGPGTPEQAGISMELVAAAKETPLLGICLGHQALAAVHGCKIVRAPEPHHGKVSAIRHEHKQLFDNLPNPFEATRYHSLVVDRATVSQDLEITAWSADNLIMGLQHRSRPHFGLQFHPESYLTRYGMHLLARFLQIAGVELTQAWHSKLEVQQ
jgi:anthranilate synthase component 2